MYWNAISNGYDLVMVTVPDDGVGEAKVYCTPGMQECAEATNLTQLESVLESMNLHQEDLSDIDSASTQKIPPPDDSNKEMLSVSPPQATLQTTMPESTQSFKGVVLTCQRTFGTDNARVEHEL